MNNALVIKNANFSGNKVTTVSFLTPCTNIEFDESSVTLDSLGVATVPYTVTPSGTTDSVSFTSSDTSVISVSGTTLTVNGIGETTLTVSCGEYSDTCTVTVDIYEAPVLAIGNAKAVSGSTASAPGSVLRTEGDTLWRFVALGDFADGHFEHELTYLLKDYGFNPGQITAIKIPNNTGKIGIYCEYVAGTSGIVVYFVDPEQRYVYNGNYHALILSSVELDGVRKLPYYKVDEEVTVPTGCTGFILVAALGAQLSNEITSETALKTFVDENCKLSIHYLPESESDES